MIATMTSEIVTKRRVAELDDRTFDEAVLASETPVVVDLWAEWCGPCRSLAPIIDELAGELDGRIAFYKVDGDACPTIMRRFEVMGFPTLLIFDGGVLVKRLVGARGRRHLLEELSEWA
jgi:thioredoxin 1